MKSRRPVNSDVRRLTIVMFDKNQKESSEAEVFEYPPDGPWEAIARGKDHVTYYPRNRSRLARFEWTLPSGQVLIEDVAQGFVLRRVYTDRFNFETRSPVGRDLGDRAILKRQNENQPWFVSWYQEIYDGEDRLESSCLKLVDEKIGRILIKRYEFDEEGLILQAAQQIVGPERRKARMRDEG